jgi:hypothetical protein
VRRQPARRAASILVLLLAGCSAATSGPAPSSAPPTTVVGTVDETCADLVVIGARGSTQDPDLNGGVGTEVRLTTERLVERLHDRSDTTVHLEAIGYDAAKAATLAAYQANVERGAEMMTSRLRRLTAECPGSRFALVGFSQGAQVVHAAATDMTAATARRVALVAMIADPRTNPADPIRRWSYADEPTLGNGRLGSGAPIDADLRESAISLCVEGDEICNDQGAPGGPPSDTHKHFYEQESSVRATARQLDAVLRGAGV